MMAIFAWSQTSKGPTWTMWSKSIRSSREAQKGPAQSPVGRTCNSKLWSRWTHSTQGHPSGSRHWAKTIAISGVQSTLRPPSTQGLGRLQSTGTRLTAWKGILRNERAALWTRKCHTERIQTCLAGLLKTAPARIRETLGSQHPS